MKNLLLTGIFAWLGFFAHAQDQLDNFLSGDWKEHWGVGQETDVNYHDQYWVEFQADGGFSIVCTNRDNYLFRNLQFENGVLSFELINTIGNDVMPYQLTLSEDGTRLIGHAISVHGERCNVHWVRELPELPEIL